MIAGALIITSLSLVAETALLGRRKIVPLVFSLLLCEIIAWHGYLDGAWSFQGFFLIHVIPITLLSLAVLLLRRFNSQESSLRCVVRSIDSYLTMHYHSVIRVLGVVLAISALLILILPMIVLRR